MAALNQTPRENPKRSATRTTTKEPIDPKRIAARKNEKSARVIKTTAESAKKRDMGERNRRPNDGRAEELRGERENRQGYDRFKYDVITQNCVLSGASRERLENRVPNEGAGKT